MKVFVYSKRPDEEEFFERYGKQYQLDLSASSEGITRENTHLAKGCGAVVVAAAGYLDLEIISDLKHYGIAYIVTRTAGFNHIDLKAAKALGVKVSYVPSYSPNAISEHTLMLALALMRKLKSVMQRVEAQDFRLAGLRAGEIRNMTIGIVGTGKIGFETIKAFKGLGAAVLAYDFNPREDVKAYAEYVDLDALYAKSDMLSFHCPYTPENYHMVNEKSIAKMKGGVYLINTARGELFDYQTVLDGLRSGKIGGLGFDVYENEETFVRHNLTGQTFEEPVFHELTALDNVIFTPHIGFYTDEAVSNMVEYALRNLYEYVQNGQCENELHL